MFVLKLDQNALCSSTFGLTQKRHIHYISVAVTFLFLSQKYFHPSDISYYVIICAHVIIYKTDCSDFDVRKCQKMIYWIGHKACKDDNAAYAKTLRRVCPKSCGLCGTLLLIINMTSIEQLFSVVPYKRLPVFLPSAYIQFLSSINSFLPWNSKKTLPSRIIVFFPIWSILICVL